MTNKPQQLKWKFNGGNYFLRTNDGKDITLKELELELVEAVENDNPFVTQEPLSVKLAREEAKVLGCDYYLINFN